MARKQTSSRASRFCARCSTPWPARVKFHTCPECGTETYGLLGREPIPMPEAERRTNEAAFERHYAAHEARRINAGEPTPEELGAEEAQTIIDLDRRLSSP